MLDGSIQMRLTSIKAGITNLENDRITSFRLRNLKRERRYHVLHVEPACINGQSICGRTLGALLVYRVTGRKRKVLPFDQWNFEKEILIRYDKRDDTWTIHAPRDRPATKVTGLPYQFISLDPGLRTHLSGLSSDGIIEIGIELRQHVQRHLNRVAKLESSRNMKNERQRIRLIRRAKRKIRNQIDDYHWKVADYLARHYKTVYIGDMSTKGIVRKYRKGGRLSKTQKNLLMFFRHYQFKLRLQFKCQQWGTAYREIDERYTSKLCTNCGHLHPNLGGKKVYQCEACKITIDRDVNGARNIYLKRNCK